MVNWKVVLAFFIGGLMGLYLSQIDEPTLESCEQVCAEIHC